MLREVLEGELLIDIEYAEVVDGRQLSNRSSRLRGSIVMPVAVRIGTTRLIDNLSLEVSD